MKHIKTFEEWLLTEAPIAHEGDFKGNKVSLGSISKTVIKKYYTKLKLVKSKELPRSDITVFIIDTNTKAVLGFWGTNEFIVLSELYLTKYSDIDKFGYKNVLQTSEVNTLKTDRGSGYASSLYLTLVEAGYTLISDYNQFDGARNLWRAIQQNIKLDVFDEAEDEITKEHKIIHTNIHNVDKEWSCHPDNSCSDVLFIAFK